MAEVPILRTPGLGPGPVPRTRAAGAPAAAFGLGGGQVPFEGLDRVGANVANFLAIEKRKADQVVTQEGLAAAASLSNQLMWGEGGVMRQEGKNAIEAPDTFMKAWDAGLRDIEAGMSNQSQRDSFRDRILRLQASMEGQMLKHVAGQSKLHDQNVLKATLQTEAVAAGLNWSDPERVQRAIEDSNRALAEHALRVGMGDEELKFLQFQSESAMHFEVVKAMVDAGAPNRGEEWIILNEKKMSPQDKQKLRPGLDEANNRSRAIAKVDEWFVGGKSQKEASDLARDIDDDRLRKLTQAEIEDQYGREARNEAALQSELHDKYAKDAFQNPQLSRAEELISASDWALMKPKFIQSINKILNPEKLDTPGVMNKLEVLHATDPTRLSKVSFADFQANVLTFLTPGTQKEAMDLYTNSIKMAQKDEEATAEWKGIRTERELLDTELKHSGDIPWIGPLTEEQEIKRARIKDLVSVRVRQALKKPANKGKKSLDPDEFKAVIRGVLTEEVITTRTVNIPIPFAPESVQKTHGQFQETVTLRLVDVKRDQFGVSRVPFATISAAKKDEYTLRLESAGLKSKGEELSERHQILIERLMFAERTGRFDLSLKILQEKD